MAIKIPFLFSPLRSEPPSGEKSISRPTEREKEREREGGKEKLNLIALWRQ